MAVGRAERVEWLSVARQTIEPARGRRPRTAPTAARSVGGG
nr:hypothetical protein [Angustibacter aerolatus]